VIKGNRWMTNQGWKIKDVFRNTSRDNMPEDETITKFGDRLVTVAGQVIAENGGSRRTVGGKDIYSIATQPAANVERLPDPQKQFAALQSKLKSEIERDVAHGEPSRLARAAYLAICLDLAPELKHKYPERWTKAVGALSGYSRLMQAIFYDSPIPAGDVVRAKAVAAGARKPERPVKTP